MFLPMLAVAVLCSSFSSTANYGSDAILGIWWNQEKTSRIEVYKRNNKYYGKIVWLENEFEDGSSTQPNLDDKNPDESLRSRKLMGLEILKDLEWDDDEWDDGQIYDPKSGNTYSCYAEFEDDDNLNRLKFRGYMGVSLLGRTSYWTRYK
ncbi:DUF2147 domain-containing protein [bacterium]|nr:DUF2147 domain-containing protein [bacterium]